MKTLFRLFLLLCIFAGLNATINAAPQSLQDEAQTTIAIATDATGHAFVFLSSSNLTTADFLPGIVFTASNNNNKSGNFQGLALRQQNVNSNQNWCATVTCSMKFLLTQGGNSANWTASTTTANDAPDIGWQNLANHFFLNTCVKQQTSALPEQVLRC